MASNHLTVIFLSPTMRLINLKAGSQCWALEKQDEDRPKQWNVQSVFATTRHARDFTHAFFEEVSRKNVKLVKEIHETFSFQSR